MKLESLKMWTEKDLLCEDGKESYGYLGYFEGRFADGTVNLIPVLNCRNTHDIQTNLRELIQLLRSEAASGLLLDRARMEWFCHSRLHDHIPYPFHRECWGFRVLSEPYAWYIACTPWNECKPFMIYCYDRTVLMRALAAEKGLPESCYAVLNFTGVRIRIRYGEDGYEEFPQYGTDLISNRDFVESQNSSAKITPRQVAAMQNGAIYGWDTPMADLRYYDEGGYYNPKREYKEGI